MVVGTRAISTVPISALPFSVVEVPPDAPGEAQYELLDCRPHYVLDDDSRTHYDLKANCQPQYRLDDERPAYVLDDERKHYDVVE